MIHSFLFNCRKSFDTSVESELKNENVFHHEEGGFEGNQGFGGESFKASFDTKIDAAGGSGGLGGFSLGGGFGDGPFKKSFDTKIESARAAVKGKPIN